MRVIVNSQHEFMKVKSRLTNLKTFWDKMASLMNEGRALDVVYLEFSKASDTISHSIPIGKHEIDERTVRYT